MINFQNIELSSLLYDPNESFFHALQFKMHEGYQKIKKRTEISLWCRTSFASKKIRNSEGKISNGEEVFLNGENDMRKSNNNDIILNMV